MSKVSRSVLTSIISAAFIFSAAAPVSASVLPEAPDFEIRTETPSQEETAPESVFYFSSENPYNTFHCEMPNCTAYAYGRIFEIHGFRPSLSLNNAAKWYRENIESGSYSYGCEPMKGAVKCQVKTVDTHGHVSVAEDVFDDGSIFYSESQNRGLMFNTGTEMADSTLKGYTLLGYIYPDDTEARFYGDGFRIAGSDGNGYITRNENSELSVSGRNSGTVSQNFRFEPLGDGNYRIYSYCTGLVLARTEDGVSFTDSETEDSEWSILTEINGLYTICEPDCTDNVLTFSDGNAFVSEYAASENQFWNLERFSGTTKLSTTERSIVYSLDCTETRTEYYTDEFLDLTGIRCFLNGNEIENIDFTKLSAFYDFTEEGAQTVTVTYGPSSISYDVTVTEPEEGTEVIRNSELRTGIRTYLIESENRTYSEDLDVNGDGVINAADVVLS